MPSATTSSSGEDRYQSTHAVWSKRPNAQLVAEAAVLPQGSALDVGCGEGADAIWLAERGWQVTAVDISPVAMARGAKRAAELGERIGQAIDWVQQDLLDWTGPEPAS